MSPKTPRKPPTSTSNSPDSTPPPRRPETEPDVFAAHGNWPPTPHESTLSRQAPATHPNNEQALSPAVEINTLSRQSLTGQTVDSSINTYWLSDNFLRGMQPADADGVRFIVGRKFVDVEHESRLHTTHVGLDESGVYRAKRLTERSPSGPVLYKNADRPTWRLTEIAPLPETHPSQKRPASVDEPSSPIAETKRPRARETPIFVDPLKYSASSRSPDAQGYYQLIPTQHRLNESKTLFAFRDGLDRWIKVDPPARGFGAQPADLPHWTDKEIWDIYRIHGKDIEQFRAEAQTSGAPPKWVEPVASNNPLTDLTGNALRWMFPSMNTAQRQAWLQSYNLLPSQLSRLQQHLRTTMTIAQWAQSHKRLTEDVNNPRRLEQLSIDVSNELNLKRGARHEWYSPEISMTLELREALLNKLGYYRNKNNCLYRTDVPALFRGDDRTPFELANDNAMLPRYGHKPGATTNKPLSATFSLKEAVMYASAPDPEHLRYNTQTNKYPGKLRDSDSSSSSDSDSSDSSNWSDADDPVAWDHDWSYLATRAKQTEMFIYALDTRNMEVVPREENYSFNSAAAEQSPTWFPDDNFEGLISVTRKGIEADRIWLFNSTLSKAASVHDINQRAGNRAERIEAATHAGASNKYEYDQLIDEVEAAGKPILRLSGNKDEYAYDITWP